MIANKRLKGKQGLSCTQVLAAGKRTFTGLVIAVRGPRDKTLHEKAGKKEKSGDNFQ
jgi:hypothetical protein